MAETRARNLSKLANPSVFSVDTSNNVGVNSTSPVEKLNVVVAFKKYDWLQVLS